MYEQEIIKFMELFHEELKKRSRSLDYIPQIGNIHVAAGSWVDPHDAQWSHQYYTTPIACKVGACQNIWRYYLYCAFQ